MKTALKFRKFNHEKTVEELSYTITLWYTELEFTTVELRFIHQLIKSYPFSNEVPNLFERIQLFMKEINTLNEESSSLLESIRKHEDRLKHMTVNNELNITNFYIKEHENTAFLVFDYMKRYKWFKRNIYEYISSIAFK